MNDLINLLQTLALVLTLILVIFVLGWIVYAFRKFVVLFNRLVEELEKPHVCVPHTATVSTAPASIPVVASEDAVVAPEVNRYACHRCKAKLPEAPTHSIVKDEIAFLVYKCRRCGKETEVDPAKTPPVT
jgi:DNA-directed RNA polymerase subunit RPC12/RpoP